MDSLLVPTGVEVEEYESLDAGDHRSSSFDPARHKVGLM